MTSSQHHRRTPNRGTPNRGTPNRRAPNRRTPTPKNGVAALFAVALATPLCIGARQAGATLVGPEAIEGVRTTLQELVENQRLLSAEKRDWELGRQTLQDRIDLVQAEIDELRQGIADARESIGETDSQRSELSAESERLDGALGGLGGRIEGFEERTRALLTVLPEPLRDRVRPISRALPRPTGSAEGSEAQEGAAALATRSLGERYLTVIGVLNEVDKFQREVTATSEVRELDSGQSAEVSVIYLGLAAAWFANGDGSVAGVGHSTPEGWTWERAESAAPAIAQALAIFANEDVASFVSLPARID